ncbi:methyl-accepting chemotaxis protein [Paraburkholderia sacchari]|uniref:methyl-accepting chemotaxis protein n=1 Tax=Paraburkholderia sacchari TaxID=159450 RepID=UPI001BD041B2|nr:methyl-accepting chemotaxis protein [Paraburkholderia sacchari]
MDIKASILSTAVLDARSDHANEILEMAEKNVAMNDESVSLLFHSGDQQQRWKSFRELWDKYDRGLRELPPPSKLDPGAADVQAVQFHYAMFRPMYEVLETMLATASNRSLEATERANRTGRLAVWTAVVIVVSMTVVVVPWILALSRSIQIPLGHFQQALQNASENCDLTQRVPVTGSDEISQTARAFNELMDRIAHAMLLVATAVESLSSVSNKISVGSMDLSARTESQAASLQETAASMEELTGTVRQNAENAGHAVELSAKASDTATRGNSVVSNVVGTMSEINAGSSKISEIIRIIEGIAFQTNILALNAAVEAARAGEQGRGFAVVAGEVRALAQRSASASKEVKELIDASVSQVSAGTELAHGAGVTMQEISSSISHVTEIMHEIAAASIEQSRGIDQIGQAVVQMDKMTQQNAALVEESAASARLLEEQAKELHEAICAFKLRISHQAGQGFRGKLDGHFTRRWTRISRQAGQRFHAKLDSNPVR